MITIKISKDNNECCKELEKKLQQLIFKSMKQSVLLLPAYLISGEQNILIDDFKQEDFIGTYINISYEE
jgi:hypothetical protein